MRKLSFGKFPKYCSRICYREAHRAKAAAATRAWYAANKEYVASLRKPAPSRFANCERCGNNFQVRTKGRFCSKKCQALQWHDKNPDWKKTAYNERYKTRSNAVSSARYYRTRKATQWAPLMVMAKNRAKKKGTPFDLTPAWATARWDGCCEVTGLPFALGLSKRSPFSPSIDQIVPNAGYTQTNSRFVLWAINSFKHEGTDQDILEIAAALLRKNFMLSSPPTVEGHLALPG